MCKIVAREDTASFGGDMCPITAGKGAIEGGKSAVKTEKSAVMGSWGAKGGCQGRRHEVLSYPRRATQRHVPRNIGLFHVRNVG